MSSLIEHLVSKLPPEGAAPKAGFSKRGIEDDDVQALLAAARVAPSADNAQTWRFVVVRAEEALARLGEACPASLKEVFCRAPLAIVVCGVKWVVTRARREQPFVLIDVPIAVSHLLLQATELGLVSAWTLECDETSVRSSLSIPDDVRVIALLALGWPEEV